jgi:hypothetical protein
MDLVSIDEIFVVLPDGYRESITGYKAANGCSKCEFCDYLTKEKRDMFHHIRNEHRSNFNLENGWIHCLLCTFTAGEWDFVARHFANRHIIDKRRFKCKLCTSVTKTKYDIKKHIRNKHINKRI